MNFQQAQTEYRKLKADYDAGKLSEEALRDQVAKLLVEDDQGRWWSIGYETGQWYVHDGVNWVEGVPPGPQTAAPEPQPAARAAPDIPLERQAPSEPEPQPPPKKRVRKTALPQPERVPEKPPTVVPATAERRKSSLPLIFVGVAAAVIIGAFLLPQLLNRQPGRATTTRVASLTAEARSTEIAGTTTSQAGAAALRTATAERAALTVTVAVSARRTATAATAIAATGVAATTEANALAAAPPLGKLVFQRTTEGRNDLYVYDMRTGALTRLTTESENHYPRWSPDGKRIAFTSNSGTGRQFFDIWVMADNGQRRQRVVSLGAWDEYPAWARDGALAFASTGVTGGSEIFVGMPGGNFTPLTENSGRDEWPSWSPEGKRIVFSSERNGTRDIWVMNRDGSDQRSLVVTPLDENEPVWSPGASNLIA